MSHNIYPKGNPPSAQPGLRQESTDTSSDGGNCTRSVDPLTRVKVTVHKYLFWHLGKSIHLVNVAHGGIDDPRHILSFILLGGSRW
jgi:hypothetical protein